MKCLCTDGDKQEDDETKVLLGKFGVEKCILLNNSVYQYSDVYCIY